MTVNGGQDYEGLLEENRRLKEENAALRERIVVLEAKMKMDSSNSSLPPSSDRPGARAKRTKSKAERRSDQSKKDKAKARSRGKQPGAEGSHLAMKENPDESKVLDADPCLCGADLSDSKVLSVEVRQVFDLPEPKVTVREYRVIKRRCSCGARLEGTFPKEARAPTCYGPNVRAYALYLLNGQFLSYERCAEALSEMMGVNVSEGFISSVVGEAGEALVGFTQEINRRLIESKVVHFDETSDQVGTKKCWFHTATNGHLVSLYASPTRGKAATLEHGIFKAHKGVSVHDRFSQYFSLKRNLHQVCTAHLMRDLEGISIYQGEQWAEDMKELLSKMIVSASEARDAGKSRVSKKVMSDLLSRYDELVEQGISQNAAPVGYKKPVGYKNECLNLAKALKKHKISVTRFLKDLTVPPTNNEAERSLRMVKLHSKISGCFQSMDHARHFARVRSYIQTARYHDVGALSVLRMLFQNNAWMPPAIC